MKKGAWRFLMFHSLGAPSRDPGKQDSVSGIGFRFQGQFIVAEENLDQWNDAVNGVIVNLIA